MGKTRDLFKKIRDTRGTFHAKMGTIKDRDSMDLIDRVPEELWMEVCDIVQEAVIKTIPKKKECNTAKWLPEETFETAMKRRKTKG